MFLNRTIKPIMLLKNLFQNSVLLYSPWQSFLTVEHDNFIKFLKKEVFCTVQETPNTLGNINSAPKFHSLWRMYTKYKT